MHASHDRHCAQAHDVHLRPYRPTDRTIVRRLVLDCADDGIVPRCLQRHRAALTDLLTRYYLDFEPESCWVVESPSDGVVGYVFGCLSSGRRRRTLLSRIVPAALGRMLIGGALWSCPIVRLIRAGLATWLRGRRIKRRTQRRFPAHLHLGIDPKYRGRGWAGRLVVRFLQHARDHHLPGVHVSVVESNVPARTLFSRHGFVELGRYTAFFPGTWSSVQMRLMGADTSGADSESVPPTASETPTVHASAVRSVLRRQLERLRRWRRLKLPLKAFDSLVSVITGIPIYLQTPFLWFVSLERPVVPEPNEADAERFLVIAPHPDDDILGVGGTLAEAHARGASVRIVYLTSGDANRAAKYLMTLPPLRRAAGYRALGDRREREAVLALRHLEIPADHAIFLNYPDRGLTPMLDRHRAYGNPHRSRFTDRSFAYSEVAFRPSAPYTGEALIQDLVSILGTFQPTVLYMPHPLDAHPDHRAGHRATTIALRRVRAAYPKGSPPHLRCYIVHVFEERWPLPGGRRTALPLSLVPASMADESWVSTELSEAVVRAKLSAIRSHSSQWLTSRQFLAGFVRTNEIYAQAVEREATVQDARNGPHVTG
jgi:LmbE family N-acetylglucosaminyl deacetylase/ribosomal protein S18 acetylase RimI-like enzyme